MKQLEPIPYQTTAAPSTAAGHFLFPLRIPDLINKHDLFEHPHLDASKTSIEAMKRTNAHLWRQAMNKELASMQELSIWEEVQRSDIPPNTKPLPRKLVFTYKEQLKLKARLVIVGSSDTEQYDIAETFSSVAPPYVIRWFFAYTHKHKLDLFQIDIKTAFLHSTLSQEGYAFIPQGLQVWNQTTVLKLRKAAYGLAICPLLWFRMFTTELKCLGFMQSLREPCLLYRFASEEIVLVLVYVDDVLIATSSSLLMMQVVQSL